MMSLSDEKRYLSKIFEDNFPRTDSFVSISGIKWSVSYRGVSVDIIYGEPHNTTVLIYRFTYKNKVSNIYIKDDRYLKGIDDKTLDKLKDKNKKLTGLYEVIDDRISGQSPSKVKEPKLLITPYLNVNKTYYVSDKDENYKLADSDDSEDFYDNHQNIVTNITTVSDYLRAITLILSNRYILKVKGVDDIRRYENIFSYPEDDTLSTVVKKDGLFFRGECQDYNFQIPGLYRNLAWIKNEDKILNYNEIFSPESLTRENTIFDNLTILQHHGGVTRILDITSNALIALYFAVSSGKREDGYVYLISGEKKDTRDEKDRIVGGEIKYPNSISVLVKASLSKLTFDQKKALFEYTNDNRESEEDLKQYIESLKNNISLNCWEAIERLYLSIQRCLNGSNVSIQIKDLYGVDIVQPFRFDRRIIQQSSAFLIFGLENLTRIISKSDLDFEDDECLLEDIQQESSNLLYWMSIIYSPENFIGLGASARQPRIQIKSQYKKRILDELDILGINESTVYPDISHKAQRINNEFLKL